MKRFWVCAGLQLQDVQTTVSIHLEQAHNRTVTEFERAAELLMPLSCGALLFLCIEVNEAELQYRVQLVERRGAVLGTILAKNLLKSAQLL